MNTSRLCETIEELLRDESTTRFQSLLAEVNNNLTTLVSQPNQPQYQTSFAAALEQLRAAHQRMQKSFEPAQIKRFEEIEAGPFFVEDIPSDIARRVAENPATPAVVQQYVTDLLNRRQQFLARIIHEKCAIKAKLLISFKTMRMGCLVKFFAMKSLAQMFGGLGRFRAVR